MRFFFVLFRIFFNHGFLLSRVVVGLHSLIYLEGKFPRSSDSSAVDVLHLFFSCIISFMLISGNRFSVQLTLH